MHPLLALLLFASLLTACASSQAGTFEGRKRGIEKAWLSEKGEEITWASAGAPDTEDSGMRYYGTYGGYDILFYPVPDMPSAMAVIGNEVFYSEPDFRLYGYQDGTFRPVVYLYRDGLISDEQLSEIAAAHRAYEDQENNTDAAN